MTHGTPLITEDEMHGLDRLTCIRECLPFPSFLILRRHLQRRHKTTAGQGRPGPGPRGLLRDPCRPHDPPTLGGRDRQGRGGPCLRDGEEDQARQRRLTLPQPQQRERAMTLPARARADRVKQGEVHDEGRQVRRAVGELAVPLAGDG